MLFRGKTPIAEPCCNYWSKYSNLSTIGLRYECFPVNLHHNTQEQLIPLIKLLLFTKSKFSTIFSGHFVPYLSFWSLSLLCHEPDLFILFMQVPLLLAKIIVGVFINTEILLILFQILFLVAFHVRGITKEINRPPLWNEIKLWDKLTLQ